MYLKYKEETNSDQKSNNLNFMYYIILGFKNQIRFSWIDS